MVEKNQELEVLIDGYGSEGQGIARYNDFVIFVPFALKGEFVKIHIIFVSKTYAVGKVIEIIKKSQDRVEATCPYFKKCGGCSLQHVSYQSSLNIKKQIVYDAITKIASIPQIQVEKVINSDQNYCYRNKSAFPLYLENEKIHLSMYKRMSHDNVAISQCPITQKNIMECALCFENYVNENLNQKEKEYLKFLVVRNIDQKLLITIVTNKFISKFNNFCTYLENNSKIDINNIGIYQCKKNVDNNVILEGDLKHVYGFKSIETDFLGIKVEISPFSFFQVNTAVMQKLYNKVLENVSNNEIVVDAYSGAGLMSALISKKAKHVYGIEIVTQATENANYLKRVNKIENLTNINGDASKILGQLVQKINGDFTLVVDPPRKGVSEQVLQTICKSLPSKIIYVSCDPSTLARDLKTLKQFYKIELVQPFDMFPQTAHVETLVVLRKL